MSKNENIPLQACVFDLDGVIVDTAKYHFMAWRSIANDLGFDFSEEQNESLKGVSRVESLEIILNWGKIDISDSEKEELANRKNEKYLNLIESLTGGDALPGIPRFLNILKERGIRIALGSASKNAVHIINRLGLERFFESMIDGTKVKNGKPHPETFLLACQELGVEPKATIVFEDAPKGIEAALAGGMFAIGVGDSESLKNAHFVIQGFEGINLERLLDNIPQLTIESFTSSSIKKK